MTNTLRQRLTNFERKAFGRWAATEINPKKLFATGLALGHLGTASLAVAADEPIVVGGRPTTPTTLDMTLEEEFYHTGSADTFSHWASLGQKNRGSLILYVDDVHPVEGLDTTLTRISSRLPFARGPFSGSVDLLGQIHSQGDHAEGIDARGTVLIKQNSTS